MKYLKILVIVLIALLLQASCCSQEEEEAYEKLIPPVRVTKKTESYLVLRDAKDNKGLAQKAYGGWSDSVYRNHKVGDILGVKSSSVKKKKEKGWLD